MPEARDRLIRPQEDLIEIYARGRRRTSVGRDGGGGSFHIFVDDGTLTAPSRAPATVRTPARVIGRENISPAGRVRVQTRARARARARGQTAQSVLPSWYPRTPLRDITAVVRAIERTRARLREREGEQLESVVPQDHAVVYPSESTSGAQLEHNDSMITPRPTIRSSRYYPKSVGKVPKILLDITQQNSSGDADFLTPQRKLLNSIDTVEKAVMEELNKLKRTPSARKEERDKRVRTLMSMR